MDDKKKPRSGPSNHNGAKMSKNRILTPSTETIDLNGLIKNNLTLSGSYDLSSIRQSSLGKLLQIVPMPAFLIAPSLCISYCNEACGSMVRPHGALVGTSILDLVEYDRDKSNLSQSLKEVFNQRKPTALSLKLNISDRAVWARLLIHPIRIDQERMILALIEDLTLERRQVLLMDTIRRSQDEWEKTFNATHDMIATLDTEYRIKSLNKSMAERMGVTVSQAIGKKCYELVHKSDRPPDYCELSRLLSYERDRTFDYQDSELGAYFSESLTPITDDRENLVGYVCVISDQTDKRRIEDELRKLSNHDPLTGLLNLTQMLNFLDAGCETARRYGQPLSLCLCDIDHFRVINEKYGPEVADEVLRRVGGLIKDQCRAADLPARYGGDVFIIAFPNTTSEGAAECMDRLRKMISGLTFVTEDSSFAVTCACGIAELRSMEVMAKDLIRTAHIALYSSKGAGGDRTIIKRV